VTFDLAMAIRIATLVVVVLMAVHTHTF